MATAKPLLIACDWPLSGSLTRSDGLASLFLGIPIHYSILSGRGGHLSGNDCLYYFMFGLSEVCSESEIV